MKVASLVLLACAAVKAAAVGRVQLESAASSELRGLPLGWSKVGPSPKDQKLELLFAVKQTNTQQLERTLFKVSDPRLPTYGQHLSNDEVHAMIAPKTTDIKAITDFLAEHGIVAVSLTPNSDFLRADVTVAMAEELLGTTYYELKHADGGRHVHRAMSYSLPVKVAAAIDFVSPTVHVPPPPRKLASKSDPSAINNGPQVLRDLYSIDVVGQAPDNKMAVTAFLEQHYHASDLKEFWKLFCNGLVCGKGDVKLVGDETTGVGAGTESMLDIQSVTGVAGNVSAEFWGFSGRSPDNKDNEPFMTWLAAMSNTSDVNIPKIFSTSYGEDEDSWSLEAATRMNTEFMKAGTRGISLLFASGDEGANCKSGKFVPETPGSSPYVTAVGGTFENGNAAVGLSSGGFSGRWAMPEWQTDAVGAYLKSGGKLPPTTAGYNVANRAYPDIAAQASDFTVVVNGLPLPGVAGTSCASPTATGVIALLNDKRMQQGKSALGFLNPWIYQNMDKWNDIIKGSNNGGSCGGGWPAVKGWDAVTGVGSPNYKQLLNTLP